MKYRVIAECIINNGRKKPGDIVELDSERAGKAVLAGVIDPRPIQKEAEVAEKVEKTKGTEGAEAAEEAEETEGAPKTDEVAETEEELTISPEDEDDEEEFSESESPESGPSDSPESKNFEEMTARELRAECKKRGLSMAGGKAELIARLEQSTQSAYPTQSTQSGGE